MHGTLNASVCIDSFIYIGIGEEYLNYLWNTGATSFSISVGPGIYSVIATDSLGCIAKDTFIIDPSPAPIVTLNKNVILCAGEATTIDAGSGYSSYLWNTGSANETISINTTGSYWVTVKDVNGCPGSDTTVVSIIKPLPSGFLPVSVSKCFYNSVTLTASGFESYLWSTNATTNSITVTTAGKYWLQVTDSNDCTGTDTTNVCGRFNL